MDLSYEEVKNCFRFERSSKERTIAAMFNLIEKTLTTDKIEFFYPKNIFCDSGTLEFLIIINKRIITVSETAAKELMLEIKCLSDVKNIKLVQGSNHLMGNSLIITFNDLSEIKCDSELDSNESWKYHYKDSINELVKVFA